jgi:hypothetical protein
MHQSAVSPDADSARLMPKRGCCPRKKGNVSVSEDFHAKIQTEQKAAAPAGITHLALLSTEDC